MRSFEDLKDFQKLYLGRPLSLLLGNFDGVHLGHQELLRSSREWCQKHNGYSILVTFDPHPIHFFNREKNYSRLFDYHDLEDQISKFHVNGLYIQKFDENFSKLSQKSFLEDFVMKVFSPKSVVIGHDFRFGQGRQGQGKDILEFGLGHSFEVSQIPAFTIDQVRVSTTAIREAIVEGNFDQAKKFLGRDFYLRGLVVKGDQRGRTIGFPTINLAPTVQGPWLAGVYASQILIKQKMYSSVTNIGIRPTIHSIEPSRTIETFVFDFDEEVYGEEVQVHFRKFIRPERKFQSLDELKVQIGLDVKRAKEVLK